MQPTPIEEPERPITETVNGKKVISPVTDMSAMPNLNDLVDKEVAKQEANAPVLNPTAGGVIASASPVEDTNSGVSPDLTAADLASLPGVTTETTSAQPVVLPVANEPIEAAPELSAPTAVAPDAEAKPAIDPNSIAL
jgi:hypothetical protein